MIKLRRNFLKVLFSSLVMTFFVKFSSLHYSSKKIKLRKNKNFIWYLNEDD